MRRLNYGIAHNATLAGLAGIGVLGISAIGAAGTVSPMAPNVAYAAGNVVSLTVGTGADATTTNYGTLSAAIAAIGDYDSSEESPYADDQYTITLLNDVTQDEGLTVSKKRFTLDLAGNTLTLSSGMTIKEDGHVVTKTSTSGGQIVGCVSLIGCELYAPIYHEVQGELITDNNGNPILDDQGHRQYASSLVIDQNTTDQAFVVGEGVTHNPKSGEKDAIVLLPAEGEDVGYLSAADIYGTVTGQVKIDKAITGTDTSENVPIAKRPMVVVHASGTVQATGTNQDVAIGLNGTGAVIVENGASVEGKETGIEAKSGILIVAGGTVKGNGATYNPTTPSTDNDLAVRGTGISVLCRGGNVPGTEVYVNANTISQPDCCVIEGKQSLAITNPHGVTLSLIHI